MTTFSATKRSEATVAHSRELVWEVLTDPDTVARLTPMVHSITATGGQWRWQLARINVLGQPVELAFTESMTYVPMSTIIFRHAPHGDERAGTDGRYDLSDGSGGGGGGQATRLRIELSVSVDLPFPRLSRPAVQAAMHGVLTAMGSGFGRSMERELTTREAGRR